MNLTKIGAYIAGKRKALGMTQAELAKKLGMSDKSVSKWERGVCLPDVSVYVQLCDILGITVNEFIAGEDLNAENLLHQSEANIIAVTEDGNQRRKRLKQIFLGLTVIYFIIICMMGMFQGIRYRNFIEPLKSPRPEAVLSETIFGESNFFLYRYDLDNGFHNITVYLTEYEKSEVVEKNALASYELKETRSDGLLVILEDTESQQIELIAADEDRKITAETSVLSSVKDKGNYTRSVRELERSQDVVRGDEVNLVCFIYSEGELISLPLKEIFTSGQAKANDYMYVLSVKFE